MRVFHCPGCGAQVYFENFHCGACGTALGFAPGELTLRAINLQAPGDMPAPGPAPGPGLCAEAPQPAPLGDTAQSQTQSQTLSQTRTPAPPASVDGAMAPAPWRPCAHRADAYGCNWLVAADDACASCVSCRLTADWPSAESAAAPPRRLQRQAVAEAAKRRVVFTLLALGLPFGPKIKAEASAGPDIYGLEFRWVLPGEVPGQPALTGHDNGVITLNLLETEDDQREAVRVQLGEPQRTVLGHLRHELSHHLHQRLVVGTPQEAECEALFGNSSADYNAALQQHYAHGAAADWPARHISAYASCHPWEDWAETCAHYLLMVDAVETAGAWGLALNVALPLDLPSADAAALRPLEDLVFSQWLPVARFLNAMSRSLGLADSYPYVIAQPVLDKLRFVQRVLVSAGAGGSPMSDQDTVIDTEAATVKVTVSAA